MRACPSSDESFSQEGKGIYAEDTEIAEQREKSRSLASLGMTPADGRQESASFWEVWRRPYLSRTVMLVLFQALQTIGFYGFANWAPTFLLKRGVSLLHSLEYTLLIAMVSPLGPLLAAWTSDRLERKWTIVILCCRWRDSGWDLGIPSRRRR